MQEVGWNPKAEMAQQNPHKKNPGGTECHALDFEPAEPYSRCNYECKQHYGVTRAHS